MMVFHYIFGAIAIFLAHRSAPAILLLCLAFRLLNALCTGYTVFNPDEYWQSMEVAYGQVWSGGFVPWEFQDHARLRGVLHPMIFTIFYYVIKLFGWDSRWMVAHGPRLVQACFAGVGDYFLYLLAWRLLGRLGAKLTLFCSFVSWFLFFCITRTLSNSFECSLCMIAFYYWPDTSGRKPIYNNDTHMNHYRRKRCIALIIAAFICVIRPTNAVLWVLLGVYHLSISLRTWSERARFIFQVLLIGGVIIFQSTLLDTVVYEKHHDWKTNGVTISIILRDIWTIMTTVPLSQWTIVSLNFVRLNSGTDLSALYGTHPWHWYFTSGLPTNLGSMLPVFIWSLWSFVRYPKINAKRRYDDWEEVVPDSDSRSSLSLLLILMFWCILTYSFNAHKEFRFILCVTPIAFLFIGRALVQISHADKQQSSGESISVLAPTAAASSPQTSTLRRRNPSAISFDSDQPSTPQVSPAIDASPPTITSSSSLTRPIRWLLAFLLVTNIPTAYYFTFVHQSGPLRVFDSLHSVYERYTKACAKDDSCHPLRIHFLMNCHTMPLYTYLHQPTWNETSQRPMDLQFLDCSPLSVDRFHMRNMSQTNEMGE